MQQALRESPFARQEVWSFIPFLYRLADDRNECLRLALAHLEAFTDLWQGEPPFLADPHNTEFVKELASAAKRRVQLLGAHQTGSADVKIGALMERLNGRPDNRQYALAALLEDKTWDSEGNQGRPGPTTRCKGIIHDRIKEVHLRLLGAPDLSSELSKKEMASCATVWFGFLKWQSLTRYQLLMIAVESHTVSGLLDTHCGPASSRSSPGLSLGHQHLPSLTSRQQERSGVSEEGLRARWA